MACDILDVDVATVTLYRDAVLAIVSGSEKIRRRRFLTSPQVTTQFLIVTSFEFQVSVPSVLTVLHCEFDVAFISRFVIVMFCEYATNVCLL